MAGITPEGLQAIVARVNDTWSRELIPQLTQAIESLRTSTDSGLSVRDGEDEARDEVGLEEVGFHDALEPGHELQSLLTEGWSRN